MTTLKGGPELMRFLDTLPAKLKNNILRGAMRAGARVVAQEVEARSNNHLIREGVYVSTGNKDGTITAKVKVKGFAASIAIWGEFGTAAHWIKIDPANRTTAKGVIGIRTVNKNAREGGSLVIGGKFVGPSVFHPGARAYPVFVPALDNRANDAIAAAASYIRTRIENQGLDAPDVGIDEEEE